MRLTNLLSARCPLKRLLKYSSVGMTIIITGYSNLAQVCLASNQSPNDDHHLVGEITTPEA